ARSARRLGQSAVRPHARGSPGSIAPTLRADGSRLRGIPMNFEPIVGWGQLPAGWRYVECAGVAIDGKDNVFVFTRGEHPVIVFDHEGRFLRSWGEGMVRRAHAITIDADQMVWLTDDLHHTIRKFTPDGKLLLTIGNPDTPSDLQGGKPFNRPTHVAICPRSGYLFVSDGYGNSRVHKYSPDGQHVMSSREPP